MSPNWSVLGLGGQSRSGIAQQTRWHGRWELGEEISSEWLAGVAGVCPGMVPLELRHVCVVFFFLLYL